MSYKITFYPNRKTVEADGEQTLLKAAGGDGIHINATCGGKGNCGKCRVIIKEGQVETKESGFLTEEDMNKGVRLACMTTALSDLTVEIPLGSQMRRGSKIATGSKLPELQRMVEKTCEGEFRPLTRKLFMKLPPPTLDDNLSDVERLKRELVNRGCNYTDMHIGLGIIAKIAKVVREDNWQVTVTIFMIGNVLAVMDIQPGDTSRGRYGAAVDIGTTSIVVFLVKMDTGKIVDIASTYNPQVRCGEDIISRIVYATEGDGLHELQELVVGAINGLLAQIAEKTGIDPEKIDTIVVSGNTTMTHLFYGLDPAHIREEPYIPTATILPIMRTKTLGLNINKFGVIYSMPSVASYVGGDISAGILASGIYKKPELSLFIDIGTNGEIVLGNSEWMVTAACSAGPAFEGGGVKFGMRAMDGAIEKVAIDPDSYDSTCAVIGNSKPIGICGSGMIDAIAEMYLTGVVDQRGRINLGIDTLRVRRGENGPEYVLAWADETGIGKDITLTEPDINNIVRTKGAIYAGFATLLKEVGLGFADVEKVYIAGGFGNYLDVERAITIGLLPDMPPERFEFLGNTSIMGAYLALLSKKMRKDAEDVARKMTYMELSVSRSFMDEYISALFLPHTNVNDFPTVERMREVIAKGQD